MPTRLGRARRGKGRLAVASPRAAWSSADEKCACGSDHRGTDRFEVAFAKDPGGRSIIELRLEALEPGLGDLWRLGVGQLQGDLEGDAKSVLLRTVCN